MSHLTGNERDQIARMLAENKSLCEMARVLGKSPSSIKREIGGHRVRAQSLNRLVRFMPCAKCATSERRGLCADCPLRRRKRCCFCAKKPVLKKHLTRHPRTAMLDAVHKKARYVWRCNGCCPDY